MQVQIIETLVRVIDVQAETEEDAQKIAEDRYFNGEEVLDASDGVSVQFVAGGGPEKTWWRNAVMAEATAYCRDECCSSDCCPEDECVLFRIQRIVGDQQ